MRRRTDWDRNEEEPDMTTNVIDETTVEYIIRDEKHFALASCVADAMPMVQMRLVRMVLEGVREKFSNDKWKVFPDYDNTNNHHPLIVLRKRSWYESSSGDQKTGIVLSKGTEDFTDLYVSLCFHRTISKENRSYVLSELEKLSLNCTYDWEPNIDEMHLGVISEYMNSLSDSRWGENFFKRAVDLKRREEIVELLAERMNKMADSIDSTMEELRSRT